LLHDDLLLPAWLLHDNRPGCGYWLLNDDLLLLLLPRWLLHHHRLLLPCWLLHYHLLLLLPGWHKHRLSCSTSGCCNRPDYWLLYCSCTWHGTCWLLGGNNRLPQQLLLHHRLPDNLLLHHRLLQLLLSHWPSAGCCLPGSSCCIDPGSTAGCAGCCCSCSVGAEF
jgi:hypothetical protein